MNPTHANISQVVPRLWIGWDPIEAQDAIRRARPIACVAYAEDALDWWLRAAGASRAAPDAVRPRLG